jgi:hypothetical protein
VPFAMALDSCLPLTPCAKPFPVLPFITGIAAGLHAFALASGGVWEFFAEGLSFCALLSGLAARFVERRPEGASSADRISLLQVRPKLCGDELPDNRAARTPDGTFWGVAAIMGPNIVRCIACICPYPSTQRKKHFSGQRSGPKSRSR